MTPAIPLARALPSTLLTAALLVACGGDRTVRVAGVQVDLLTPAAVDPLATADTLVLRVLDEAGDEVASAEGDPGAGLTFPPVTAFGRLEVEVTARRDGTVVAAGRTGLLSVTPGEELTVETLFLPVNEAVPLEWTPGADRVGHVALGLDGGRALLVGGRPPSASTPRADSEYWSPSLGYDGQGPVLPESVSTPASTTFANGTVLLAGGATRGGPSDAVMALDPVQATARLAGRLDQADRAPCAIPHPSLGALVFSETATGVWAAAGRVGADTGFTGRNVSGCGQAGGRVLLTGTTPDRWSVLDLVDATWPVDLGAVATRMGGVPGVQGPMVHPLDDDRVWVAGGFGFSAVPTTRIVPLSTATPDRGPDLARPRVYGQTAAWRDDLLVLTGGFSDEIRSKSVLWLDLHHPEEGPVLSVPVPVRNPTTLVLPGGTILYTGGLNRDGEAAGAWAVVPWVDAR